MQNPERQLCNRARDRAKRFGLEFDITYRDFDIPELCPLLGIPLYIAVGQGHYPNVPTLDRIDNSKGYVKGNVWVISKKANTMKSNASWEELVTFALNILEHTENNNAI